MALETLLGLAIGKKMLTPSPYKGLSKREIEKEKIREQLTGKAPTEERLKQLKEKGTLKQRKKIELKESFKDSSKISQIASKTPFIEGAVKTAKGVPRSTRGIGLALGGTAALNYFAPSILRMVQNPAMFNIGNKWADYYDKYYAPYSAPVEYSSLLGLRYLESAKQSGKEILTKEVQAELKAEEQATKEYRIKKLMEGIESSGGKTSKEFLGTLSPEVFDTLEKEYLPKALEEPVVTQASKASKLKTPFSFLKKTTKIGGRLLPAVSSAINVSMAKEYEKIGDVVGAKLRYAQAATSAAEVTPAIELAAPASLALEAADDILNLMSGNDTRKKQFIASVITGNTSASFAEVMGLPQPPNEASFKPIYSKRINPKTNEPFKIKQRITPFGSANLERNDSEINQILQPQDINAPIGKPEFSTYDLFKTPNESQKVEKKPLKKLEFEPKTESIDSESKPIGYIQSVKPESKTIEYQPSMFREEKPLIQITDLNKGNELFRKNISFGMDSKENFNEKMLSSLKDSLVSAIKETQSTSAIVDNSVSISGGGGSGGSDYYTSSQRGDPINHMRSDLRYKLNKII